MPYYKVYDWTCSQCGNEVLNLLSEEGVPQYCEKCGAEMKKKFPTPAGIGGGVDGYSQRKR